MLVLQIARVLVVASFAGLARQLVAALRRVRALYVLQL